LQKCPQSGSLPFFILLVIFLKLSISSSSSILEQCEHDLLATTISGRRAWEFDAEDRTGAFNIWRVVREKTKDGICMPLYCKGGSNGFSTSENQYGEVAAPKYDH